MDIPELIKALDAEIAQKEAEFQRLCKKLQLLEEMKQLRAKATPIAWYVTGCSTMLDEHDAKAEAKRCGGSAKAVPLYTVPRGHAATQPAEQGVELANCKGGNWLTVVYRDIQPGDEARAIVEHPKASALSWSHALRDRDTAIAAQAKQGEQQ